MSLAEILEEIPKLSFAERQELVRHAVALDESDELSADERVLLDERMEDFRQNPEAGIPLEKVKGWIQERLSGQ